MTSDFVPRDFSELGKPQEVPDALPEDIAYKESTSRDIQAELTREGSTDGVLAIEEVARTSNGEAELAEDKEATSETEPTFDDVHAALVEARFKREAFDGIITSTIGREAYSAVMTKINEQATEEDEAAPVPDFITGLLKNLPIELEPEAHEQMRELILDSVALVDRIAELQEGADELAEKECTAIRGELGETVNWRAVVYDTLYPDAWMGSPLTRTEQLWSFMSDNDDAAAGERVQTARGCKAMLEQGGFVLREGDERPDYAIPEAQQEWIKGEDICGEISTWVTGTSETIDFFLAPERARAMAYDFGHTSKDLFAIRDTANSLRLSDKAAKVPAQLREAICHRAATLFDEFDRKAAHDQLRLWQELEKDTIQVTGEVGVAFPDIDDLQQWLWKTTLSGPGAIPAQYTRGIQEVAFVKDEGPFAEVETRQGAVRKITKKYGNYNSYTRAIHLSTAPCHSTEVADLRKRYSGRPEQFRPAYSDFKQTRMERAATHELGHHLHSYTLPFSWLREWNEIRKKEPVDVTPYVTSSYLEGEIRGTREDLCESLTLYRHEPGELVTCGGVERARHLNRLLRFYPSGRLEYAIYYAQVEATQSKRSQQIAKETVGDMLRIAGT